MARVAKFAISATCGDGGGGGGGGGGAGGAMAKVTRREKKTEYGNIARNMGRGAGRRVGRSEMRCDRRGKRRSEGRSTGRDIRRGKEGSEGGKEGSEGRAAWRERRWSRAGRPREKMWGRQATVRERQISEEDCDDGMGACGGGAADSVIVAAYMGDKVCWHSEMEFLLDWRRCIEQCGGFRAAMQGVAGGHEGLTSTSLRRMPRTAKQ